MKFHRLIFVFFGVFLFATQTAALNHQAQVFVQHSDADAIGTQVEVVTQLIFSGVPTPERNSD